MVTLTQAAAEKVKEIINAGSHPHDPLKVGLRLYVKGGGCSGLEHGVSLDEPRENDHVFELDGVKVFIDPISYPYVKGAQIDYEKSLMNEGFKINNPNAKSTCGCGHSFEPK